MIRSTSRRLIAGVFASFAATLLVLGVSVSGASATPLTSDRTVSASPAKTAWNNAVVKVDHRMSIDCSTFSAADRQKAIKLGMNYCGALGFSSRGYNTNTCGTASVYVDRVYSNRARISWGLHSTAGNIIGHTLQLNYGPAITGSFPQVGIDMSPDVSGSYIPPGTLGTSAKMGATVGGSVGILGWTFSCTVYASEPVLKR